MPARRRGDAAGSARHGRAGRPEGLPDRAGEGAAGRRCGLRRGRGGRRERAQGRARRGLDGGRSRAHDRREPRGGVARALDLGEPERVRPAAAGRLARVAAPPCRRDARGRSIRERNRPLEGRRRAVALSDAARIASLWVLPGDREAAQLVRRPRPGRHRPALGHRPGAACRRLVAGAVLRGHRRPRRQQLPDRDRRPGSRAERAWLVDERPRPRHAEASGVDDARDLLDVELRRGGERPAADVGAAALHGLRRDPQRRAGDRVLRRAEPEVLGPARCRGRLELDVLGAGARAARARDLGGEPARAGAQESGDDARAADLRSLGARDLATGAQRRALGDRDEPGSRAGSRSRSPGSPTVRLRSTPKGAQSRLRTAR